MTINVPLLEKTLQVIKDNPNEWHQGDWRCRSGMCFAGWASHLAGGKWVNPTARGDMADALLVADPDIDPQEHIRNDFVYGPTVSAANRARTVLGLGDNTYGLFNGSNTVPDLEAIVSSIKDVAATES